MRKVPSRLFSTCKAYFDDAAERVVVARILRAHGSSARLGKVPLRLVVSVSKVEGGGR